MKKIVLFCSAGMSTSLLVEKMRKAAKEDGFECSIDAHPISSATSHRDVDCVLLGPQVRYELKKTKAIFDCPVEPIDMIDYGTMNGRNVLDFAKGLMNVKNK